MLYLISTPIGNLADITLRALDTLRLCDMLLCEDTRHSKILLNHYQIKKPLFSYHKFNEVKREPFILESLQSGKKIGFLSDAGSPSIADPGYRLVAMAQKEKIPYTILPGPCSVIAALALSGWEISYFQWIGFLPSSTHERKKQLIASLQYPGITIAYETPYRIHKTLEELATLAPSRSLCLAREMTKMFEEVLHGTAQELLAHFASHAPKGEIVLMFSPHQEPDTTDFTIEEHVQYMQNTFQVTLKEAIKMVAELQQKPKREIYQLIHKL